MIRQSVSITALTLALAATPALAVDSQTLAQRLAAYGITVSDAMDAGPVIVYGKAQVAATTIQGPIIFNNVTEASNRDYRVDSVVIATFENESQGVKGTINNIQITGLALPAAMPNGPQIPSLFRTLSTGSIRFLANGIDAVSADGFKLESTVAADPATAAPVGYGLNFELTNARITGEVLEMANMAEPLAVMGLNDIKGTARFGAFWDMSAGTFDLSQIDINLPEAAAMNLSFRLGGVTPALLSTVMDTNAQLDAARASGDSAAASKLQEQLGIAVLSQVTLVRAEIGFLDKSVTAKAVNFIAEQSRMTQDQLMELTFDQLGTVLDGSSPTNRGAAVLNALETFLKAPGILRFRAEPAAPANLLTLAAMVMGSQGKTEPVLEAINLTAANQ